MVETVNNLLQPHAHNAWQDLSTSDQIRAATLLLDIVEEGAFVLADNLLKTDIVRENSDNIRCFAKDREIYTTEARRQRNIPGHYAMIF
ncbi:hypothetical protein XELAEV_18009588mg [Xenopus laevis]|uniref:AGRL2-4 GAIN subdomain A domain-containing protein n=1 Tax=Xenopus laevis TaxID=8355 RepID=A0A974I0W9_XENLA|nr:hypothetical protein XELAEV_18009588mg [Xenopus laevis]